MTPDSNSAELSAVPSKTLRDRRTAAKPAQREFTVLSLFSGAGGMDIGLEAAGFHNVGCLETDETCRSTLDLNRPAWKLLGSGDVLEAAARLSAADLGLRRRQLDLLAGGPPCQPFSTAGQWSPRGRLGMEDERADTVLAMLDLVETLLPKAILIENVAGFMRGEISAKPYLDARLEEINDKNGTNYRITAAILDAAEFGVPQHRRRVIAIATRDGKAVHVRPQKETRIATAWDAIGHLPAQPDTADGTWTQLLPCIPEGSNYQYLTSTGGGDELFGYRTRYWSFLLKLTKNRPSWTIPASPGPSTGPFHWDNRHLTVTERLRLQSFPEDWRLAGTVRAAVRQAGNATPPLLAEIIGNAIASQALGMPVRDHLTLSVPPAATAPPPPEPPKPVPAKFRSMIGPKQRHLGPGQGPAPRRNGA